MPSICKQHLPLGRFCIDFLSKASKILSPKVSYMGIHLCLFDGEYVCVTNRGSDWEDVNLESEPTFARVARWALQL